MADACTLPTHTPREKAGRIFDAPPIAAVHPPSPPPSTVSPRELDVVRLVADGRSNREIAEELVISRKTAEAHVSHILTKLGMWRRVQIAMWSMQHDLHAPAVLIEATRRSRAVRRPGVGPTDWNWQYVSAATDMSLPSAACDDRRLPRPACAGTLGASSRRCRW